ncbi:putative RNA methyltransferase [Gordonia hankookensis]|uniref:Methyltransferase domain-containing protein n=1 Tax=Gordonia hankookensis TaxID=589403 RepID=A0ABR7W7C0_9ACTN|nr:methyltransferase domain-containing protein [Gordonia hankookensis]MBD1318391.1 methyltransferase domain-containing protein [Gordonia hankookensis]
MAGPLRDVVYALRCPVCAADLAVAADHRSLHCDANHRFDIARQGYVSLIDGRSTNHLSDTAQMVAARRRVHESGFFGAVSEAVADVVERAVAESSVDTDRPGLVLDAGAGTGHYLAAGLDRVPGLYGIGLDLSKYCARSVARSHPRAASVVADVWRPLPIRSSSIGVVLSIFSPRNVDEFVRVLHPRGVLVVVTPNADHLGEIIAPMGMLAVGADKDDRLRSALGGEFEVDAESVVGDRRALDADAIVDVVAMGPTAFHRSPEQIRSDADMVIAEGGGPLDVSVSVTVTTCRPRRR